MLRLQDIQIERGGRQILGLKSLQIATDRFTVILGHNGSGKSTLMSLMARQLVPERGQLTLAGQPLAEFSQRRFAQKIAYLPQQLPNAAGLTVRELVRLGRFPWRGLLGRWRDQDQQAVQAAMAHTHIEPFADHLVDTLSGGERQRAWIAMLLAQEAQLILLDEPTSALDLAHQYEVIGLLRRINQNTGRGMVAILHDINLSCRFADDILALKKGQLFFQGPPQELLKAELLSELYDIDIQLIEQPGHSQPVAVVA